MPLTTIPASASLPFLDHLQQESARFRAVLTDAPAGSRVPTCPDWDTDDLLWHLADVQWFWGQIAHGRLTRRVTISAVDAGRVWTVRPVRVQGVDGGGTSWDEQRFLVAADPPEDQVAGQVHGTAADLDCWLWNRPLAGSLEQQGDPAALATVDAVVTGAIG